MQGGSSQVRIEQFLRNSVTYSIIKTASDMNKQTEWQTALSSGLLFLLYEMLYSNTMPTVLVR